uniref:Uncharacterized protein n=1 Tax=Mycena chlorophos TaxID=658473 RepID=A0ABQ0LJS6_MYCCL|nr:predicted protein [Mycena chlorophos]
MIKSASTRSIDARARSRLRATHPGETKMVLLQSVGVASATSRQWEQTCVQETHHGVSRWNWRSCCFAETARKISARSSGGRWLIGRSRLCAGGFPRAMDGSVEMEHSRAIFAAEGAPNAAFTLSHESTGHE